MLPTRTSVLLPAGPESAPIRLHQPPADPDPDDPDWDAILPDEEEAHPEPGDFWIDDDDWEDAA